MIGSPLSRSPLGGRGIGFSPLAPVPGSYTETPPPEPGEWQLEASTDVWLLEDSGTWLLEAGDADVKASDFDVDATPAAGDGVVFVQAFASAPVNAICDFDDLKTALLVDAFDVAGTATHGYVLTSVGGVPTWVAP